MKKFWFVIKVIYVTITSLGCFSFMYQFVNSDFRSATKDFLDELF